MKISAALLVSLISLESQAFYLNSKSAGLEISLQGRDVKRAVISFHGFDYKVKGVEDGDEIKFNFKDKDSHEAVQITLKAYIIEYGSGVATVWINGNETTGNFLNSTKATF